MFQFQTAELSRTPGGNACYCTEQRVKPLERGYFRYVNREIWPVVLKKHTGLEGWLIAHFRTVLSIQAQKAVFAVICSVVFNVFTQKKDDPNIGWPLSKMTSLLRCVQGTNIFLLTWYSYCTKHVILKQCSFSGPCPSPNSWGLRKEIWV
jgi:hypothetical protein